MVTMADRLRALMATAGYGPKELTQRSGLARGTVQNLLNQVRAPQDPDTVKRLADAFGITIDQLLQGVRTVYHDEPGMDLSPEEADVLGLWRGIRAAERERIRKQMRAATSRPTQPHQAHRPA